MNDFEDDLTGLLTRAVATVEIPDVDRTVERGITRGRSRRRLRRLSLAGQGALGVGVVAGIAALTVQFAQAPASRTPAPRATNRQIEPAASSGTPTPTPAPPRVALTPQVAAATLMSLLPNVGHLSNLSGATPFTGFVNGVYNYDDGHGLSEFILGVGWHTGDPRTDQPPLCTTSGSGCTVNQDGSQTITAQGPEYINRGASSPLEWSVQYQTASGLYVSLYERNSPAKAGPVTRAEPPLSMAQLIAIVTSSAWSSTTTAATAAADAHLFTPGHTNN